MTVSTSIIKDEWVGSGSLAPRNLPFPILEPEHVIVTVVGVVQILGTHYTISGTGREPLGPPAVLTPLTAWNGVCVAQRETPALQEYDLDPQFDLRAETLEYEVDRRAMVEQEITEALNDLTLRGILAAPGQSGYVFPAAAPLGISLFGRGPGAAFNEFSPSEIAKGDPGGNAMAVGLFTAAAGLTIPIGTDMIMTNGYSVRGIGMARYVFDASINAAYVAAHPRSSFMSANGRGFALSEPEIWAEMFGAGAGGANDAPAVIEADTYCQNVHASGRFKTVRFGAHIFNFSTQMVFNTSARVAWVGDVWSPFQLGSEPMATVFRWTGGATPAIVNHDSGRVWIGWSVQNRGTGTDWIHNINGQWQYLDRICWLNSPEDTRWSNSAIKVTPNSIGYTCVASFHFVGAAPKFIDIDGQGSSNGITPIELGGSGARSLAESNSDGPVTLIYCKDEHLEGVSIDSITFNEQAGGKLTVLDNRDTAPTHAIESLVIRECEFDLISGVDGTDRLFFVKNCDSMAFCDNTIQGGGTRSALIKLENSHITGCTGNRISSMSGPLVEADATSSVTVSGRNYFHDGNTRGLVNDDAIGSGLVKLAFGALVPLRGDRIGPTGGFVIEADSAAAWTLSLEHSTDPLIGGMGYFYRGQTFTVTLRNVTGGAIAVPTLASGTTYFKLQGGAFPVPAAGKSITLTLRWSGKNVGATSGFLEEVGRTGEVIH